MSTNKLKEIIDNYRVITNTHSGISLQDTVELPTMYVKDGRLVIDLSSIEGIDIITKENKPAILSFVESLVISSNKNVMFRSNFTHYDTPNKYKIWMNPICNNSNMALDPSDIDTYAELQYLKDKKDITDFTYSKSYKLRKKNTNRRKVKRRGGHNCACCSS